MAKKRSHLGGSQSEALTQHPIAAFPIHAPPFLTDITMTGSGGDSDVYAPSC